MKRYKIVSLFAGCGGLDLGFSQAGFDIIWANEYDKTIWETYEYNHPKTKLDKRSILDIPSEEIPFAHGIIGGPPCQSWSLAGAMRGAEDHRGQLFFEYLRILRDKKPLFFLAENVPGIISRTHIETFQSLIRKFMEIGYIVTYRLLEAKHYGVPQERKRVIIVGYSEKIGRQFCFPIPTHRGQEQNQKVLFNSNPKPIVTLKKAIGDLPPALPAQENNKTNGKAKLKLANHEYMTGSFSTIYMSRNRKKEWDEPSFTIQAGGRHAPLHPGAKKMIKKDKDWWVFNKRYKKTYRRMSVRECARVQTFPDSFVFKYKSIANGYKMVGNAVPVLLARVIAKKIKDDLMPLKVANKPTMAVSVKK